MIHKIVDRRVTYRDSSRKGDIGEKPPWVLIAMVEVSSIYGEKYVRSTTIASFDSEEELKVYCDTHNYEIVKFKKFFNETFKSEMDKAFIIEGKDRALHGRQIGKSSALTSLLYRPQGQ